MLPAQYASMITLIFAIAVELWWIQNHKERWLVAVPVLLWLAHSFFYYLYWLISCPIDPSEMIAWGATVRLQGYITILILGLYRMNGKVTRWIRRLLSLS